MQLIKVPNWMGKLPVIKNMRLTALDTKRANESSVGGFVQVIQEATDKNSKDIEDWRNGITAFDDVENPKSNVHQDLLDYILMDSYTHSLVELRNNATLGSRFYVYDAVTGTEQPEKTAMLQTEWFYKLMSRINYSGARGYMGGQLINPETMEFAYFPHRNIIPSKNQLLLKVSDDKGVDLLSPAFANRLIYVKNDYPYGYLNDVVPAVLWMMNVMMSWAEATEKYGIPPLIATSNKGDDKSLDRIMNMLSNMGESLRAAVPEGVKIEVMKNSENVDPEKMFKGLITACKEFISTRIVGGTMIVDNGSSLSQSQVHNDNFEKKIIESDKRNIEFVVSGQLLPMMAAFGKGFTENDRFAFDRSQQLNLSEHFKIVEGFIKAGYDVDMDWMKKQFQVPLTGKTAKTQPANQNTSFNKASSALVAALDAKGVQLPNYVSCCSATMHTTPVASVSIENILSALSEQLIKQVHSSSDTTLTQVLKAIATYKHLNEGLRIGWDGIGDITYNSVDTQCLAFMEYNLFEFSRLKEQSNVFALNDLLFGADKKTVKPFNEFRNDALKYLSNPDVNWLKAEYNYCTAVGQGASTYNTFMKETKNVSEYAVIRTVGDSQVRPAHQLLNGKILRLTEKGGLKIWIPFDIGCRCDIEQFLGTPPADMLMTSDDVYNAIDKTFGDKFTGNKAAIQQVFAHNEMYLNNHNMGTEINKLTYKTYGNKSIADISNLKKLTTDTSITPGNVNELFKKAEGENFMGFNDYLGRKLTLPEKQFKKHTSGKYILPEENRHQLFPLVDGILNNPDEVYFFGYDKKQGKAAMQTNYVKFFDGEMVVVNTQTGSDGVEINSWYKSKVDEEKIRKGYLIHQNKKS